MKQWLLIMGLALGLAGPAAAQAERLSDAAASARRAWAAHDPSGLLGASPRVVVQLPGADPAAALGREQAVALLRDYLARGQEVGITLRSVREMDGNRGLVELSRRYRVAGTQDVRAQSLLLGYRQGREGWVLTEIRVVE